MLNDEGCPCGGKTAYPKVNFLGLYDTVEVMIDPMAATPWLPGPSRELMRSSYQPLIGDFDPPDSIPKNVASFFHAQKTGGTFAGDGLVPLPSKSYGGRDEIEFGYRIPDMQEQTTHGDIGVDPFTTEAHTAMLIRAAAAGVNVDILNLYNHYPPR
jgi:hypothetical protein